MARITPKFNLLVFILLINLTHVLTQEKEAQDEGDWGETFRCNPQTRKLDENDKNNNWLISLGNDTEDTEDKLLPVKSIKDAVCKVRLLGNTMCEVDGMAQDFNQDSDMSKTEIKMPGDMEALHQLNEYSVTTADGYILKVFRIRSRRNFVKGKGAILVQHGLLSSSADWIANPHPLPYMLAAKGYDVFLGNARGTHFSRRHTQFEPNNTNTEGDMSHLRFWNYSYHEMGIHDLPPVIDLVTKESGQDKIFYAAHSMGCTMFFIALSEIPSLNSKIRAMFALSPAIFIGQMKSLVRLAIPLIITEDAQFNEADMGSKEFTPIEFHEMIWKNGPTFCSAPASRTICQNVMFLIAGYNACQMNNNLVKRIVSSGPSSTSLKTMAHFGQMALSGGFRKFNYFRKNRRVYGRDTPPEYNLENVKVPVYVYYGNNDLLIDPKDAEAFCSALKLPEEQCIKIDYDLWNHIDFVYAKDADKYVYRNILDQMEKYKTL